MSMPSIWNAGSWKQVQEVAPVAVGIFASGERGIWTLAAVAQQGPLPMSTLKYDSNTKSWISPTAPWP